jgi:hypothetical protein
MLTAGAHPHACNTHAVGDNQHSFHFVKYREVDNQMYTFADDVVPRWITSAIPLDYNTVAGGDKFGNIVVCRLPTEISDEVEEDPTGGKNIGTIVRPIAPGVPSGGICIRRKQELPLPPPQIKHVSLHGQLTENLWCGTATSSLIPPPFLQKRHITYGAVAHSTGLVKYAPFHVRLCCCTCSHSQTRLVGSMVC